jgi:uncharacterized repeat protein (TIGR01451 family)
MRRCAPLLASALALLLTLSLAGGGTALAQGRGAASSKARGKGGKALAALQAEHAAHKARGRSTFQSRNPLLGRVGDWVVVDAVASGAPFALRETLAALGMEDISQVGNVVSGRFPIASIDQLEGVADLQFARPSYAMVNAGSIESQGDAAMRADDARAVFGPDGSGVTVGTLSDSFDRSSGAAGDVASGDLPAGIVVLDDSVAGTDEGRAMMQIVHDVAPGASQAFHTAFGGQADFALGIQELAGCPAGSEPGCTPGGVAADVIVDDVIYFAEPMFQDGVVAQAVDHVVAAGVSYVSSAGNYGRDSYEDEFRAGASVSGGTLHDFDPGLGVDTCQAITLPSGTTFFSFQWAEPYFSAGGVGSASDLDIRLFFAGCNTFTGLGGLEANVGNDPIEVFGVANSGGALTVGLQITHTAGPFPRRLKYVAFSTSAFSVDEFNTASGTIFGHANAAGAEAVGAAYWGFTPEFGVSPPVLEWFSSAGTTPVLFDASGAALPAPAVRAKPGVVAPDGVSSTFPGLFFGTSAAAPHAAGVAALILDAAGPLQPSDVYRALEDTAIDMDDPATAGFDIGFDHGTGFGLIDAVRAVDAVLVPVLTVTKSVGKVSAAPGDTLVYTLTYQNTGNGRATGVTVTDVLPDHTTFVSASGGGVPTAGTVAWPVGDVPAGTTASVMLTVRIDDTKVCRSIKVHQRAGTGGSRKSGKSGKATDCVREITNSGLIQSAEVPTWISSDTVVTQVVKAQRMKSAKDRSEKSAKSKKSEKSEKSRKSQKSGKRTRR